MDAGFAKFDGFLEERDTDAVDSGSFQGASDGRRAVPIGVGFEYAEDTRCAGEAPDYAQVVTEVAKIDFRPCRSDGIAGGCSSRSKHAWYLGGKLGREFDGHVQLLALAQRSGLGQDSRAKS